MSADLIAEYEAKLATVKQFHPGWRGEEYVAHAEAELAAVEAGGLDGLKAFWAKINNPQPEAAPAGPDWAVLGPRLAAAMRSVEGLLYEAQSDIPVEMRAKRDVLAALEIVRANIILA